MKNAVSWFTAFLYLQENRTKVQLTKNDKIYIVKQVKVCMGGKGNQRESYETL